MSAAKSSVLVVGGGSIGERHVRCFLQTGRVRVSLCELDDRVRERLATSYPLAATYADLPTALGEAPDAAVVATPAHLHIGMAQQLVEAGCHVLIEKPLSVSTEGIQRLHGTAAESQRVVGVAYVLRLHPGLAALRESLLGGAWGTPLELVYVSGQDFPSLRPAYREIYYRSRATGGGAIQDALTHGINAASWLVGPIDRVAADAAHLALAGVEVEDTVHVLARHGGVLACYALNQHQPPNEASVTIHCRDASLRLEFHAHRWMIMPRGETEWLIHSYEPPQRDTLFLAQANAFLDAIGHSRDVACSLEDGLATLRTGLAILAAADERRWVDVDPSAAG